MPQGRLVGIYDADGGIFGELRYVIGRAAGRAHCALCDITHGSLAKKPGFRALEASLGLPFVLRHRNELSAAERAASEDSLPCVLLDDGAELKIVLGPDELDKIDGDVAAFSTALERALRAG